MRRVRRQAAQARAAAREAARLRAEGPPVPADAPSETGGAGPDVARAGSPSATDESSARSAERRATTLEADRRATDRRIAEQLAARQRREAAERELAAEREREQEREAARAEARAAAEAAEAQAAARAARAATESRGGEAVPSAASIGITDADLQLVYERFANLVRAIENRDIAAVVSLTEDSGARVQQLLQVFENSESLDARITNVAARSADSSITGTLRIDTIFRSDGSRVEPPPALQAVALTSTRDGGVWSAFDW